jgi:hypothetical protein
MAVGLRAADLLSGSDAKLAIGKGESAMIVIEHQPKRVEVTVYAEFTLADYQEFESASMTRSSSRGQSTCFSICAKWPISPSTWPGKISSFARAHANDFSRIAVLTHSQWVAWSAWLSQIFVRAEMRVFDEEAEARLAGGSGGRGSGVSYSTLVSTARPRGSSRRSGLARL